MPVADLYGVTASLCNLARYNIWRLTGLNIIVSDLPPEQAEEAGNSHLNLHLFHAAEDPSRRNALPGDSLGRYPIAETPLPLILYYVLTAHSVGATPDVAGQQRLMGLAMKTFHDFPQLDEAVRLPTPPTSVLQPVFDLRLRGNQNTLQIIPRQLSPEESINFWSAALNHTARLTAYYEVRSTLLPPDEPQQQAGLVISYGLAVATGGRPRLLATSSVQTLALPAALGGQTLTHTLHPAELAVGSASTPSAAELTATGSDLGDGTAELLLLSGPGGELAIDPTANPAWQIRFSGDQLRFVLQASAQTLRDGAIVQQAIVPGIWTLAVVRRRQLAVSGGPARSVSTRSNQLAFAVTAAVAALTPSAAPPRLAIDLAPGVSALDAEAGSALSIAGEVYRWHPPTDPGPLVPGEYRAVSASRFEARLPFDPMDGQTRPVRLGLAGVDCAPCWVGP